MAAPCGPISVRSMSVSVGGGETTATMTPRCTQSQRANLKRVSDAGVLVLDANPLDDSANIRQIHRVVRGGAVLDPAQVVGGIRFGPLPPPAR